MDKFKTVFGAAKSIIIGMIHVQALPGTPRSINKLAAIIDVACSEARIYRTHQVDAILVENMHDSPWLLASQMGPETTSCMTAVCAAVRRECPSMPLGVQVLAGANKEALAIALASDLNFIRAEGFVFSHIADEGPIHACAGELLRYRKDIDAKDISIFTDVKKKHCSHSITSDLNIAEVAKASELFLSDGVIVTGTSTGEPTSVKDIEDVRSAVSLPVLVGSGVTIDNLHSYIDSNAIIVGSHLHKDGDFNLPLSRQRVQEFMKRTQALRNRTLNSNEILVEP